MTRERVFNARCALAVLAALAFGTTAGFADRFGDVTVRPVAHGAGETHHGYRELLFFLENHSTRRTHEVTLVFPDRFYSWGSGAQIRQISRTVSLSPGSRMVVPLWQPPLPVYNNGLVRVLIAGEAPETISVDPAPHVASIGGHFGGAASPATVLVSRALDYDGLGRLLMSGAMGMSAQSAAGPPDAGSRRGITPNAWTPDTSAGGPHWIELDYDPPIQADQVRIRATSTLIGLDVRLVLTGVSGTNLLDQSFSSLSGGSGSPYDCELSFPRTAEPVKTVRLDFGMRYAGSISVDAVQLVDAGSGTAVWASKARASSEAWAWSISGSGTMTRLPGGAPLRSLLRSELPISEWSEYWLSYSAYDAIAVSASELRSARPAVLNALWHYVECGGVLFVLGPGEAPASWRRAGEAPLSNGRLLTAGFGKCFLLDAEQPGGIGAATAKAMMAALDDAAAMWRSLPDENTANSFYPVVENAQIPVRGMVFIMLVFVIVIGPANLIYLSWTGRRTWLLWTIPAISVLATVMVFAYTTLREGITPDVRMEALTFLDQSTRRAASVGITAFYCPLTPSGGLFFSAETEATALVQGWNHQSDSSREVDWTRGQHFRRGWVTARVPAHFWLRKAETRRERIQLEMEGGKLIAVNGLGAPIQSLWLSDHDGRIYTATNVAAGQRTVLLPSSAAVSTSKEVPLRALASTALGYSPWEKAAGDVLSLLTPGSYIAELEGNPFVENALGARSITSRSRIKSTVYGLLEPAGAP